MFAMSRSWAACCPRRSSRDRDPGRRRALEQVGQSYGKDAGTAPDVQEPSAAIQAEVLSEESLELGEYGGTPAPVVDSCASIERRVVPHRRTLPTPRRGFSGPGRGDRPAPGTGRPLRTGAQRDALAAYVIRKLRSAWNTRKPPGSRE